MYPPGFVEPFSCSPSAGARSLPRMQLQLLRCWFAFSPRDARILACYILVVMFSNEVPFCGGGKSWVTSPMGAPGAPLPLHPSHASACWGSQMMGSPTLLEHHILISYSLWPSVSCWRISSARHFLLEGCSLRLVSHNLVTVLTPRLTGLHGAQATLVMVLACLC